MNQGHVMGVVLLEGQLHAVWMKWERGSNLNVKAWTVELFYVCPQEMQDLPLEHLTSLMNAYRLLNAYEGLCTRIQLK